MNKSLMTPDPYMADVLRQLTERKIPMFTFHKVSEQEWYAELSLPAVLAYRDEVVLQAYLEAQYDKAMLEAGMPDDADPDGPMPDDAFDALADKFGLLREAPGCRVTEDQFHAITGEFDIKAARRALRKMGASVKWSNGVSYIADRKWETV